MMGPSDHTVDAAVRQFRILIEAAENSNHAGEVAIVRAAASGALESALRLVLPEIRNSIASGDGRFTSDQIAKIETALAMARGDMPMPVARAA